MPGNINGVDGFYVTPNDVLTLDVTTSVAGLTAGAYQVQYRIRRADDGMVHTVGPLNSNAIAGNNGPSYSQWGLPEGWLISATVYTVQAGVQSGAAIVQLFCGPGLTGAQNSCAFLLIQDTPSSFQTVGWAYTYGSPIHAGTAGQGQLQRLTKTAVAGANISFAFNGQQRFQINNVRFRLVTSATVASRQVVIVFTDAAANIRLSSAIQGTQPASQTNDYNFCAGVGPSFTGAATLTVLPAGDDVMGALPAGFQVNDTGTLTTAIVGIQAADQVSNFVIDTQSWHEAD